MTAHPKPIDSREAARLRDAGALMVDVREAGEFAGKSIPGSINMALSQFEQAELSAQNGQAVIFYCASGGRTGMHIDRLAAKASGLDAYVMQDGINGWSRNGLPVDGQQGGGLLGRLMGR